ncbi:non-ribosomal peptide synthetase [Streptomyces sp. MUM 178J]|uniref:non-ribosomal peptide synthetase n=1 Tax=Streptomyces sp. MUM 178J TaxID=2791991 RepID=UPI001F03F095|nr:amino acid adenylation domain-containing protein [Streptomyces sp. MUM 178J]WRQ77936.1 amino acid adenylation domain-containing protein [Streptomyces sp. MUM 178J]
MQNTAELSPLPTIMRPVWTASRLTQDLPVYTESECFRLTGPLDKHALLRALDTLYARHPLLRTVVTTDEEDRPLVRVLPPSAFPRVELDLREHPREQALRLGEQAVAEAARRTFDVSDAPLAMAHLIHCAEEEWLFALVLHHLVCDGDSFRVLFEELSALYTRAPLPAAHPDPLGALRSLRDEVDETQVRADLDYWQGRLGGITDRSPFPSDRVAGPLAGHLGARCRVPLDDDWFDRMRAAAAASRVSPFAVAATALSVVLSRFARSSDVLIGSTMNMRSAADANDVVGYFMKTIPLRFTVDESALSGELLRSTHATLLDAMEHTGVEFDEILGRLNRLGDGRADSEFQAALELHYEPGDLSLPGVSAVRLPIDPGTAKYDFTFHLGASRGAESYLEYRTELYDAATARALAAAFRTLLAGLCADQSSPVERLPILESADEAPPHREQTGQDPALQDLVPLPGAVRARAALHPDRPAVVLGEEALSYAGFVRRADLVGRALAAQGVGPGDVVGVAVGRSIAQTCALFGVWSAGAVCAALDPALPADRLKLMVEAAGIQFVLVDAESEVSPAFSDVHRVPVHAVADEVGGTVQARNRAVPAPTAQPGLEDIAYLIFTSGTSGPPKPVAIRHLSLAAFGRAMGRLAFDALPEPSRVAVNAPFSFDASWQGTGLLHAGHTLYPVPDKIRANPDAMVAFLRDNAIDVLDGTPTHVGALVDAGLLDNHAHVPGTVVVGGEALPAELWRRLATADTRAFNVYGPTEFTVNATGCRIDDADARPVIGRPLAGVTAQVMDALMRQVPDGFPGELHLSGPQISVGYIGRPDLTAERFRRAPNGTRGYATGDVVRRRSDGTLEFIGRSDDQVKLRGYRVEPAEITAVLREAPGVTDAAIVVLRPGTPTAALHAALVLSDPARDPAQVSAFAAGRLPAYMVPVSFSAVPRLPRKASGKVDVAALASLAGNGREPAPRVDGADPLQRRMASLWARLLRREAVSGGDDFFSLGGNSLLVSRLVREIKKEFGVRLPLRTVFGSRTLTAMSEALRAELSTDASPADADEAGRGLAVPLAEGAGATSDEPALVLFHPLGGSLYPYQPLLRLLPATTTVWGIRSPSVAGTGSEPADVATLVEQYTEDVVRRIPARRLVLFGWSLGGLIALAVAAELEARGVDVDFAEVWDCGVGAEEPLGDRESLRMALRAAYGPEALQRHASLVSQVLTVADGETLDDASLRSVQQRTRALGSEADNVALPRHFRVIRQQTELFRNWMPTSLRVPLHAVYSAPSLRDGSVARTDWQRFTSGPWTEDVVEADHYDMVRPPHINASARGLLARLPAGYPRSR